MNIKKTNKKLLELYESKYPNLSRLLTEKNKSLKHSDKATNPLLLKIDENYANAKFKIMFFGQETNTWLGEQNNAEFLGQIEPVYHLYENFFLSGNCYSYGGQFWNGVSRCVQLVEKEINEKVGVVWNNIIKVGKCGKGAPFASIQEIQFEHFNVYREEVDILEPDVLIFFSGPNYDNQIKKAFGRLDKNSIDGFTERQLCEIKIPNSVPAFRTYHPNYLWRNDINKFLEPIVLRTKYVHNNNQK